MSRSTSAKNSSLEALRGLAALVVFLGHLIATIAETHPWIAPFHRFVNWGVESVILFFLLSGVVIRMSEERKHRSPAEFALDRVIRIYPLYLIAIALACLAARWLALDVSYPMLIGNLAFVQSLPGYVVHVIPSDLPFWSLAFEMTFYACFALVLAKRGLLKLWWAVAILSLGTFFVALPSAWASHFRMIFAFSTVWLVGYAVTEHRHRFRVDRESAIALLPLAFAWGRVKFSPEYFDPVRLIGFGVFLVPLFSHLVSDSRREIRVPAVVRVLLCAGVLAVLWAHSDSLRATKVVLSTVAVGGCVFGPLLAPYVRVPQQAIRALVYLGSISYAFYVVHFPIVLVAAREVHNSVVQIVLDVVVVLALSHLLERVLQPRVARLVRRLRSPVEAPAGAVTVGAG